MGGKSLPFPPGVTVCSVVISDFNKILLIQEKGKEIYGKWNFPGGRLDPGESVEEGAIREAKEETGFDVRLIKQLLQVDRPGGTVLNAFLAEITGGSLDIPDHEILDAKWFTLDEINNMKQNLRDADYILETLGKL